MSVDQIVKLIYRKDFDALKKVLTRGASLNAVDEDGRTPLMHAVLAEDAEPEMVRVLIEKGANPNAIDKHQNWTALHFAARDQKLPIVAELLKAGAKIDAEDSFGNTPLWRCVMAAKVNQDLVRLLLVAGANPLKKNRSGVSPRDVVQSRGNRELFNLLSGQEPQ